MKRTKHPSGWWNDKDHCIEECKKWKTLNALRENQGGCLISIHRHGWKEECYRYLELGDQSHATKRPNKRPAGWWDDLQHCNTATLQHINACVVKIDGKRVKNDDKRNDAQENALKKCNSE